jgi:choline/glycine/proline betaine transport protein
MLAEFPLSLVMSALATAVVVTIFITSSDSGSLVIDHITSGGKQDVSNLQRAFWALTEGAVASVLLIGGGLSALQAASIATGVPFAAILLIMCYTVYRGLDSEYEALHSNEFRRRWTEINEQAEPEEVPSLPGQTFIVDGTDITDVPDEDPTVSDD